MKKEIYKAAVAGNVDFLREARNVDVETAVAAYSDDDLLGLTNHGNNIIHVATQHNHLHFIIEALQNFSAAADRLKLISTPNADGETPLHFAAKQHTEKIAEHLITCYQHNHIDMQHIWTATNKGGNTPLHVALLNGGRSIPVAAYLLDIGPEVATFTNDRKETPLHLAVKYDYQGTEMSSVKMMNTLNGHGAALTCRNSLFGENSNSNLHYISLIRSLLDRNSEVCYSRDADGLTPLLRAAINSNLPAIEAIITDCPESIEICDPNGKNLLHYIRLLDTLKARKFLENPIISVCLINQQDDDGNTPVHIAVMNRDFGMVKAMAECNSNFSIQNNEGHSAQTLFEKFVINDKQNISAATEIPSKSNILGNKLGKKNEVDLIKEELMSEELYKLVNDEKWETLIERVEEANENEKWFLSRLPDGSNIMHIAVEGFRLNFSNKSIKHSSDDPAADSREAFIVSALKKFPVLSSQTNHRGETPLHLAMYREMLKPDGSLFNYVKEHFRQIKDVTTYEFRFPLPPWKAKTAEGNTLLHSALLYSRTEFAEYLMELDEKLVEDVNNLKETPLHILCRNESDPQGRHMSIAPRFGKFGDMVDLLLEKNVSAAYSRDAEGFTPLLRAVHGRHFGVAARILYHCPQSVRLYDNHGRNLFHWIQSHDKKGRSTREFFKVVPQMRVLMNTIDDDGNKPLYFAFKNRAFGTAHLLTEDLVDKEFMSDQLLYDINTIETALGEAETVPLWYKKTPILTRGPFAWSTTRSHYGVRKTDIKEYMSALTVVAALLTTLTFTAAFTVPGGYDDKTGVPMLLKKAAFQVFMVSDVVGMCCSVMVLFCLVWILTTYHDYTNEKLLLVDTTIIFLQGSFYATLVAFMTGVYVTTYPDTRWLAISTCVLCTALIISMRRHLLTFLWKLVTILFFVCPVRLSLIYHKVAAGLGANKTPSHHPLHI